MEGNASGFKRVDENSKEVKTTRVRKYNEKVEQ